MERFRVTHLSIKIDVGLSGKSGCGGGSGGLGRSGFGVGWASSLAVDAAASAAIRRGHGRRGRSRAERHRVGLLDEVSEVVEIRRGESVAPAADGCGPRGGRGRPGGVGRREQVAAAAGRGGRRGGALLLLLLLLMSGRSGQGVREEVLLMGRMAAVVAGSQRAAGHAAREAVGRRISQQELEGVVDHVTGAGRPFGNVRLVQKAQGLAVHLELVQIEAGQVEFSFAPAQKGDDVISAPGPRIRAQSAGQVRLDVHVRRRRSVLVVVPVAAAVVVVAVGGGRRGSRRSGRQGGKLRSVAPEEIRAEGQRQVRKARKAAAVPVGHSGSSGRSGSQSR